MSLSEFNEAEGIKLLEDARKGDKNSKRIIVESFRWLIKSDYSKFNCKKGNISFEDFENECIVKIIECIKKSRARSHWQFCRFVETSVKNCALDFVNNHREYNRVHVICEKTIENFRTNEIDEDSYFENHVVSEITAYESFHTLIKDKLSKRENGALHAHISGQSLKEYAAANGIKVDTARRALKKAINKIVNKEEIREYCCLTITFFMFLRVILNELNFFDIVDVLG